MTKRKLLNQNVLFFLISLLGLFIFSCKNPLAQSQENQLSKETVKLKISTNFARTVLPTQFNAQTPGLTWTLTGIKDGASTSTDLGTWSDDDTGAVSEVAYSKMTSAEISVDVGTWNFTLDVTNSSDEKVLTGTTGSIDVSTDSTLTFVMQEPTEGNVAPGQIEFTLNFPSGVVGKVEATLTKYGDAATPVDSGQVTLSTGEVDASVTYTNTVSAGTYMLKLDLQQQDPAVDTYGDYETINTYTCLIRVAPGLCSTGTETLTSLAKLYKITYELNEGTIDPNVTITSYNKYTKFELPTPIKDGYTFLGWCTHESCSVECEQLQEPGKTISISEDTKFYAKWQEQTTSADPSDQTNGLLYFSKTENGGGIDCLEISTPEGLNAYRDYINGTIGSLVVAYRDSSGQRTFSGTPGRIDAYLKADITVEDWIPIGIYNADDTASNKLYSSNFYGNGYTITIKTVNSSATNVGLFGYAGNYNSPNTISNLIVKGDFSTVTTTPRYAGGIVSYAMGVNIENCVNYATIKATFSAGGIVGYIGQNSENFIIKCINLGQIIKNTPDDVYYGGIAGLAYKVNISDCINLKDLPFCNPGLSSGIVYVNTPATSSIDRCINVGKSACPSAYAIANSGVNSNCYYNSETTFDGQGFSDGSEKVIPKTTAELCNLNSDYLSDEWSFAEEGEPTRYPLPNLSEVYNEAVWSDIKSAAEVDLPEIEVPSTEFVDGAYYVSDSGSDSFGGLSAEASYKTLKKAISSANNSDENRIIYVTGTLDPTTEGIENPSTAVEESNSVFYIQESGFTNQIQIIGYNDAIFSGNNATRIFSTRNSYNFKFKNITFQNANTIGSGGAFYYYNGILELENCNFRANVDNEGGSAIYVYGSEGQLNLTQTNCEDNIYASSATVTINDDCIIGKEGSTNRITLDRSTLILNGSSINIFESVYIKNTDSKIKIGEKYVHGEDKIKIMIAGSILSTNFLLVQECSESIKEYFEVISEDGEKTYTLNDEGYVSE